MVKGANPNLNDTKSSQSQPTLFVQTELSENQPTLFVQTELSENLG